jgi:hypothetical protein
MMMKFIKNNNNNNNNSKIFKSKYFLVLFCLFYLHPPTIPGAHFENIYLHIELCLDEF